MNEKKLLDSLEGLILQALPLAQKWPSVAHSKGPQDYVTDVDLALDRFLSTKLPQILDVPVLSEERTVAEDGHYQRYWMIDPLDGTGNFLTGLPFYGISVALIDQNGPVLAAVASAAGASELWSAARGVEARRNGKILELPKQHPELIVLSTGLLDQMVERNPAGYQAIRKIGKIRNLGAQALHLCGVASGQFAAVLSREARVWDEVAGGLILREAGGMWLSNADSQDWTRPAHLMALEQHSIACYPALLSPLQDAVRAVWETEN